mmetsp:Transcript_45075/g.124923  ORF Transcript_45075/g.124923 Transcript_45075/m.124923 type:complete len:296 (+) Transcript_45075:94-981(+)
MAAVGRSRTNWLLFAETAPCDRTRSLQKPRRPLEPLPLERLRSSRGAAARHPDEWARRRKLLLGDHDEPVQVILRPHAGGVWDATGSALSVRGERAAERSCPAVVNNSHACMEFPSAFPDFSAVGARCLQPEAINRVVFEVNIEPTVQRHFLQVGIAHVHDDHTDFLESRLLSEHTPLLASITYNNVGDVNSSIGDMDVLAPGAIWPGLRRRLGDWYSGAPQWLAGTVATAVVMLEVDLQRGRVAMSVDKWSEDPATLSVPALCGKTPRLWRPFVSLTAPGQQARILDIHARVEA